MRWSFSQSSPAGAVAPARPPRRRTKSLPRWRPPRSTCATINLRLTERGDLQLKAEVPAFTRAVRAGWSALEVVVRVGAAGAGFLLPFAPLGLAGWWAVRRRRPPVTEFSDPVSP